MVIITIKKIRQKAYESIRDYIISNGVPPGGKIDEDELARNLVVSKTSVREALSKLTHDGIVEIIPKTKIFSATPKAHQGLHSLIYNTSKSPRLIRIIQSIYDLSHMFRLLYFSNPERVKCSLKAHI